MKLSRISRSLLLSLAALTSMAHSAPLFPDLPAEHWARDAVATLAARGLVEGYPDGTFKGDRAMTRWEVAVVVARALARMENEGASFATRADLEALRPLVNGLRDELEAMGVRISALEDNVSDLNARVTELERISFYGYSDTRVVMQSFTNDGALDNDAGRRGAGRPSGVPYLNYTDAVGTRGSVNWRPSVQGVLPVVDYRVGRALSSGTGFTSLAVLGMNIKVSDDIDAGAEFAAYSSQGDAEVDAYWGVSAPYLQNPFTALSGSAQSLDNTPYTRMTLDKFWVTHKPSGTRVVVGTIDKTKMAPLVYAGQGNLGVYGPGRWPGYGFDVSGGSDLGAGQKLSWEVLGSRFGDGVRFQGGSYQNYVLAGNLGYESALGDLQLNFSRMSEETPVGGGNPFQVGLTAGQNVPFGASNGWSIRQWVNPPGYFANQRSAYEQAQTLTLPNTADTRPISGWNGNSDNSAGLVGGGNYGPQSQDVYGAVGHYNLLSSDDAMLRLGLDLGMSDYKPNKNSAFTTRGTALRAEAAAQIKPLDLGLNLEYLSVDPDYAPAAWAGDVTGSRGVRQFAYTGVGFLIDNVRYPQNREGFRLRGDWAFDAKAGKLWASGSLLRQKDTSLYNVRVTPAALGPGTPTNTVLGFSPGFVDPVFYGYASPLLYGNRSRNSFDDQLNPLEDQRGKESSFELGATYRWADLGLRLSGSYSRLGLKRDSALSAAQGGSQNAVDIDVDSFAFEGVYEITKKWSVNAGVDYISTSGHYDPAGLYNSYALATGRTDFTNLDSDQFIPHLGFDLALSDKTNFGLTARHYKTMDHVDSAITPGVPELGEIGSTQHPFNWSGWQLSSEFKVVF